MIVSIVLDILAVALLWDAIRWHSKLFRTLSDRRQTPGLRRYPSVAVIRPIKGVDVGLRENLRAGLEMDYEGACETVFVLDGPREPAFPLLKEVIQDFCARNESVRVRVLFCGEPPADRTGKLNAMIAATDETTSEVVAFIDSDLRPEPDHLRRLVDELYSGENVGSAFGQVIVSEPPLTAGDVGYALLLNGFYTPAVYWTAPETNFRFPFIMGQMMVLRRSAIDVIGGLQRARGHLVDDMRLGQLLHEAGFENVLAPVRLPLVHYGLDLRGFWKLYVRWISFSRQGLPGSSFKMISWRRGLVFWLGLVLAVASAIVGSFANAGLALAVPVAVAWSLNRLHHRCGGARLTWKQAWVSFALVVVSPVVYLSVLMGKKVTWRGREYKLDFEGKLADAPEAVVGTVTETNERRRTWMYVPAERERRRAAAA